MGLGVQMSSIFNIDVRYITVKEYAKRMGEGASVETVKMLIDKGVIPTMERENSGEKIFIDLVKDFLNGSGLNDES